MCLEKVHNNGAQVMSCLGMCFADLSPGVRASTTVRVDVGRYFSIAKTGY